MGSMAQAQVLVFPEGTLLPTLPPNFVHMSVITCVGTHTFVCMWSLEVFAFFLSLDLLWNSQMG